MGAIRFIDVALELSSSLYFLSVSLIIFQQGKQLSLMFCEGLRSSITFQFCEWVTSFNSENFTHHDEKEAQFKDIPY